MKYTVVLVKQLSVETIINPLESENWGVGLGSRVMVGGEDRF